LKRRWPTNYDDFERKPKRRFTVPLAVLMAAILILVAVILVDPVNPQSVLPAEHQSTPSTRTSTITTIPATLTETPTLSSSPTPIENPSDHSLYPDGLWVLSLADGYYTHLFAYHPADLQLTRLTNHPWDDMHPSISPDGTRLAYTSRRNGFWDIYVLDLVSGNATRVTDSLAYYVRPTWSPDGLWMEYES
jgi:TolB protein